MVLPGSRIHYRSCSNPRVAATSGEVTRRGAKCDCFSKVFSLPAFENQATTGGAGAGIGTANHRDDDDDDGQATASNFVLQDGKSLMECITFDF